MANPTYVVTSGLSRSVVMPRARALAVLARLNAAEVPAFGHRDWRLPTTTELLRQLLDSQARPKLMVLATINPKRFDAWLAAAERAGADALAEKPSDLVVLWPVRPASVEPGFSNVVAFATNSIALAQNGSVVSGDVVTNDASSGPWLDSQAEVSVGVHVDTPAGFAVKADTIKIKQNAVVAGDVFFNELDGKGTILGGQTTPLALPVFASLPPFFTGTPGSQDVSVSQNQSVTLPPGDYGVIDARQGASVLFTGGVYNLASISASPHVTLAFGAASQVRIAGKLDTGEGSYVGPATGSGIAAHDVVFYVAGVNGSNGNFGSSPKAVELGTNNQVFANFYVPNGTLKLRQGTEATGAFLGRDVDSGVHVDLTLDSYFVNQPPEPQDDSATVDEGGTVTVLDSAETSLLANDSDPNGDNLAVTTTPVSGPSHGSLTLNADGTFSYTHDGSETTSDSFVYQVCDDGSPVECATATVTITVNPVNDPPTAVGDSATVDRGGTVTVLDSSATSLLANDSDPEGDNLTVTTTPLPRASHGDVSLNADGTFSYTNDGSGATSDSFVYEVCDDGVPVECSTATVTITVNAEAQLTVIRFGLGTGTVSSTPAGIDCGETCTALFSTSTAVDLSAIADDGSVFSGYSGDPDCADGSVTMDADKVCFVRFDVSATPAVLTITLAGTGTGRVVSSIAGVNCPGDCSEAYPIPTRVQFDVFPSLDSVFVGWSGDAACDDGDMTLSEDTSCVATFDLLPPPPETFNLTLHFLGGGGGTVVSNPSGLNCDADCTVAFAQGTAVTLFGRPSSGSLDGWGGDCSGVDFSTMVTLDADKTCTVTFSP